MGIKMGKYIIFREFDIIVTMVEIVHLYHGSYPFGIKKQSEITYLQETKQNLNEDEIALLRQKSKIFRSIHNQNFIKLTKFLKEDSNIYLVYQYEQFSLQNFVQSLKMGGETSISRDKFKALAADIKVNIDSIIESLIKAEIKTTISLQNLIYCVRLSKEQPFLVKLFVDSEAEYLSLVQHKYRAKDSKKKDRQGINIEFLQQFYQAERKRLFLDFEQLVQKILGKIIQPIERRQSPNFVINGTKLVFINSQQKQKQSAPQINEKNNRKQPQVPVQQKQIYQNVKVPSNKKINQEAQSLSYHQNLRQKTTNQKNQTENNNNKPKKSVQGPIVDFDQSFEPEFIPEEFTKQKTYIYQEKQYLDSLQDQLKKIAKQKQQTQSIKPNLNEIAKAKEEQKNYNNNHAYDKVKSQYKPEIITAKNESNKQIDLTISKGSNGNGNNQSTNLSNGNISSNNDSYEKKQKLNKYKMKIITSHEIQIEGGGDEKNVQEFEKQIVQGIKSGKININELTSNNQKANIPNKTQLNQNSRDNGPSKPNVNNPNKVELKSKLNYRQSNNNQSNSRQENSNKSYSKQQEIPKQNGQQSQKDKKSNVQKTKNSLQELQDPQIAKQNRQTSSNRIRSINQIIQRIGLKSNPNIIHTQPQTKNPSKTQTKQYQHSPSFTQNPVPNTKFQKVERVQKVTKLQKIELGGQKAQKQQKSQIGGYQNEEKVQKAENYMTKIRQAKTKAEQILREYTKKKQ